MDSDIFISFNQFFVTYVLMCCSAEGWNLLLGIRGLGDISSLFYIFDVLGGIEPALRGDQTGYEGKEGEKRGWGREGRTRKDPLCILGQYAAESGLQS
jgi:hypothetical protein